MPARRLVLVARVLLLSKSRPVAGGEPAPGAAVGSRAGRGHGAAPHADEPAGPWLLAAKHRWSDGTEFWCLPGGKVDEGELAAEAAVRELREEAGIDVEVGGVVWLQDRPEADRMELIFAGRVLSGASVARPPHDDKHLVTVAWRPLSELAREDFRPASLLEAIRRGPLPQVCHDDADAQAS
jgi:ADP-ribose pyrophosphatase YjhB (NUDIX family)